jgi:hypothetical protein
VGNKKPAALSAPTGQLTNPLCVGQESGVLPPRTIHHLQG